MEPCTTCGTEHLKSYDHAGEPSLAPCVKALAARLNTLGADTTLVLAEKIEKLEARLSETAYATVLQGVEARVAELEASSRAVPPPSRDEIAMEPAPEGEPLAAAAEG